MASFLSGLDLVEGYNSITVVKQGETLVTVLKSKVTDGFVQVAVDGEMYDCDITRCVEFGAVVMKDCYYKLMEVFIKHKSGLMA